MKTKKKDVGMKTITLTGKTWLALTQIKIDAGYSSIDEVVRVLLGEKV
jgi:hypothetical protein